jgi:hypothetical protein
MLLLLLSPHYFWTTCTPVSLVGLLPALTESCTHIAAAVRLASNEHRLPYMILATALLSLWRQVVQQWPGSPQQQQQQQQQQQPILCSPLGPTLQPAIALTAAILSTAGPAATAAGAAATAAAAGSSSSLMDVETSRMEALACVEATDSAVLAADVIVCSVEALMVQLDGDGQQQLHLAPLVSQDLLLLVATGVACECGMRQTMTKGASPWACGSSSSSSSSSRRPAQQQQYLQVPPYHEQLLSCLGVMTSKQLPAALGKRRMLKNGTLSLQLLRRLLEVHMSLPQQQQPKLPDAEVTLLLLCCIEAALLVPGPCEDDLSHLLEPMTMYCLASGIGAAALVLASAADKGDRLPAVVAVQVTEQCWAHAAAAGACCTSGTALGSGQAAAAAAAAAGRDGEFNLC